MPRKSIQKSQPKDFESKRKNPISLGDDSNLDNDFKSLKIGDTPTGLEFKLGEIRSTADNFVTHKETTEELFVTKIKGNKVGSTTSPQFLFQNPDPAAEENGLWFNVMTNGTSVAIANGSSAHMVYQAEQDMFLQVGADDGDSIYLRRGTSWLSGYTTAFKFDMYNTDFYIYDRADEGDYFKINVGSAGATTISTTDNGGAVGHLTLDVDGDIELNADNGTVAIKDGTASHFLFDCDATRFRIYDDTNESDFFTIIVGAEGATTIRTTDADTTVGHLTLQPDGDLILDPVSQKVIINSTDTLYFDGGGDTGIVEHAAGDRLIFTVGGDSMFQLKEIGDDGNEVSFLDASVGWNRQEATFSATGVIASGGTDDTDIDFRFGNKYRLELTGDITTINLIFPSVSGNFLLTCRMNGDHDVTNWKVWEDDESAATVTDVMWAGGSVPAFTAGSPVATDIVSFYWDANEQECYGVASLAFATP